MRLLRDIGVVSLSTSSPANQVVPIETGDLGDIAMVMTQAMQELWRLAPQEMKQRPGSGYLNAPTNVTLTATIGSATISAFTTWASWMEGCTVRIAGDDADNELLSSTLLARPYTGASGSGKAATVYADSYTLDATVEAVSPPLFVAGRLSIPKAQSMEQFMRLGQWPGLTNIHGVALDYLGSFGLHVQKTTGPYPWAWFQDGYYDETLTYLKKRIRFTPMPTAALAFSYVKLTNPIRITASNIVAASVTVASALTPLSVNGSYVEIGAYGGFPFYYKAGNDGSDTYFLWNTGDTWLIAPGEDFPDSGAPLFALSSLSQSPAGTYTADGGTGTPTVTLADAPLPLTNEAVESLFIPICRQLMTGLGQFKSESAKPEIARAYKKALDLLENSTSDKADIVATYPVAVLNRGPLR